MGDPEDFEQEQDDADTGVEISDLDGYDVAGQKRFTRFVASMLPQFTPEKRTRRRTSSFVMLLFVLLVLLVITFSWKDNLFSVITRNLLGNVSAVPAASSAFLAQQEASFQQADIACLVDAAWSPDSNYVAVLGYRQNCAINNKFEPGMVDVYDGHTGKQIHQILPDGPILRAIDTNHFTGNTILHYYRVIWSPDASHIAILFTAGSGSVFPAIEGVLLVNTRGGHSRVMLQPLTTEPATYVWDVVLGKYAQVMPLLQTGPFLTNVAPALAYRWGAGGTLIAETPSGEASLPPAPVGNPDGAPAFTIWQEGWASLTIQNGNRPVHRPGVYTWNTIFAAWSPDGRYLAEGLFVAGRFSASWQPPTSQQELVDLQMEHLPVFPVRDSGLERILKELKTPTGSPFGSVEEAVSWRPDGRIVAVNGDLGGSVYIFDCSSGRLLASLQPAISPGTPQYVEGLMAILRWSPDGSHLFMLGAQWGIMTLWGPSQLPSYPYPGKVFIP